ncbi:UNVERIFIED_CONTAM: hypothetical protein HHA_244640 [Hammondia hammondi]|eukprot:XP_008884233.1 hypothetical protein HHA_244640 [Hammondia hammondi]
MSQNPTSKMAMTISSPTSFSVPTPHSPTASDEASARGVSVSFFAHTPHPSCGISASLQHPSCRNAPSPASLGVPDSLPLSPSSYRTLQVASSRPVRRPSSPPTPSSTIAVSLQVPPSAPSATRASSPQRPPQAVSESPAERKLSTGEELTRRLLATWVVSANASKKGGAREGERRPKRGSRPGSRHFSCEFPSVSTHSSFPSASGSPVTSGSPSSPTPHLSSKFLPQSRSPMSGASASSSDSPFSSRSPSAFPSSSLLSIERSPSREQDVRASVVQAVLSTQARGKSARRSEEQTCMRGLHAQARGETKTQDVKVEGSFGIHGFSRLTSREGCARSVIKEDKDQGGVFKQERNNSWNDRSVSPPSSSPTSDRHLTSASGSSSNSLPPLASGFSGGSVDPETYADERQRSASRRSEGGAKTSQASARDTSEREREEDMTESEDELVLWDDEDLEAKEARTERQCTGEIPLMQQSGSGTCGSTQGGEEDETQRTKRAEKTFSGQVDFFGAGVSPEDGSPPTGGTQQADKEDEREGTVSRVLQILRCETLIRDAQAALRAVGVSVERLVDPESVRSPAEEPCEVVVGAGETREQRSACVGTHMNRDAYTAETGQGRREGEEKGGKRVISHPDEEDVLMGDGEETHRASNRKRSAWMRGEKSEEDLHDDPAIQTLRALLPSLLESCPDWIDEKLNVGRRGEWVAFTKILPEILERRYGLSVAELRKEGPYCWVGRGRLPKAPWSTLLSEGSLPSLSLSSCTFSAPPLCSSSSDSRFYSTFSSASSSSLTLNPGHVCVAREAKVQAGCDSPLSFFSPLSSPGARSEEDLEVEVEEEARADDASVELKARWVNGCTETGLPYDIRIDVFNATLRASVFLEVKATVLGRPSFFLSAPEIQFARSQGKSFVVLALWNVRGSGGPDWALTEDVGGCESLAEFLRVLQTDARDRAGASEEGERHASEERGGRERGDRGRDTAEAHCRDKALLGADGDDTVSIKCTFDDFASTRAAGAGDSKGEQTSREFSSSSLSDLVSCLLQSCDHT